jgi:hypothetical protein
LPIYNVPQLVLAAATTLIMALLMEVVSKGVTTMMAGMDGGRRSVTEDITMTTTMNRRRSV